MSEAFLVSSAGADQAAIADRLADGRLRSHVAQIFPFAQLPDALQLVETGRTQGKIIVTPWVLPDKQLFESNSSNESSFNTWLLSLLFFSCPLSFISWPT